YRAADYAQALDDLAGLSGPEADYNRGNALARLGRLDEAIAAYERTLDQVPDHEDAKANLDLVRQLKDGQEPPPQQSQDPGQSQPGSDGGQGQSQGDGSQGADSSREAGEQPQGGQEHQANQGTGESESGEPGAGSEDAGQSQASTGEPGADQAESGQSGEAGAGQPGDEEAARASEAPEGALGKGPGQEPDAGDLGQSALGREQEVELPSDQGTPDRAQADTDGRTGRARSGQGNPTGKGQPGAQGVGAEDLTPEQREQIQAMDAQLRRVPDDPAGLLRQRFLLQHLRREGRLQ
ncbi:MAG: tetratricopeptide repeat protein, partial [Chromatiaceae bacterium]